MRPVFEIRSNHCRMQFADETSAERWGTYSHAEFFLCNYLLQISCKVWKSFTYLMRWGKLMQVNIGHGGVLEERHSFCFTAYACTELKKMEDWIHGKLPASERLEPRNIGPS